MANKKRNRKHYSKNLGIFYITRKDILALEDIIRKHMKSYDEKRRRFYALSSKKTDKKDVGSSSFSDTYIEYTNSLFGGRGVHVGWNEVSITQGVVYNRNADSISDIPKGKVIRYLRINGKPGISLEFTPRKTILNTHLGLAKGLELNSMNLAIERIEKRLAKRKRQRGLFNKIDI